MNAARLLWFLLAAVLIVAIVAVCIARGWGAALLATVFALLPDIALLGAFAGRGRLKPSRVGFYNLLHAPALAIGLAVLGAPILLVAAQFWGVLLAGLAWLAHIAVDRAAGFGLRAADGSILPVGGGRLA
ncbi:DUF4260 family protein [Leucobacter weissii]|uniref:DUF4260 family protein n=1 Tax=Leucobacter weissii TaxID=1983706 RepID=A0A939MHG9_9MICO|nr:DUF4260 family protein [Leucobacter weissii]MBO1901008.1 DUF4260 family protein [Leucobacter weissii]